MDHGSGFAQHGVNPGELRQLARHVCAHGEAGVRTVRLDNVGMPAPAVLAWAQV